MKQWVKDGIAEKTRWATGSDAGLIAESLWSLVEQGKLAIRAGGYVVKRGRGRSSVEPEKKK